MRRVLALTWPDRPRPDGVDVAIGCAGGVRLRYELERLGRGDWLLTVIAGGRVKAVAYTTRPSAKAFARRDFERRQRLALVSETA